MISEVVASVLTEVVTATGRRIGAAVSGLGDGRYRDDLEVAAWFNTYRFTDRIPDLPLPAGVGEDAVAALLASDACHAVLHELLAARLCDAPEADIAGLNHAFRLVGGKLGSSQGIDAFCDALYTCLDEAVCTLVGRLEGGIPGALPKLREGAIAARITAVLHAIERHTAALSNARDLAAEQDFLTRYRRHVLEHHGMLRPPDFERRRRVPIGQLYVPPDIVQVKPAASAATSASGEQHLQLTALAARIDRTVLLGSPGAGKTTAAYVLMHDHGGDPQLRTPFLVTLRQFASEERSVVGHIEHELETFYQCPAPSGQVARLLLDGGALVIFDGLDELADTSLRARITEVIERFATEFPLASILVTSRIVGYEQAALDEAQFVCYRLGDFDDERVREYVQKWFTQEPGLAPGEAERWCEAFVRESESVPDLRANPLMLALMCILYRGEQSLPHDRAGVYEQCATLMFRRWDAHRGIQAQLRARHLVEPSLRHLAFWLLTRDDSDPAVTEEQLVAEAATFLQRRGFESHEEALEAAREFVAFSRGRAWVFSDVGTTASGQALFTFTHRTFLEYFAAYHLAAVHDTPERLARALAPHVARREWEVVAELAVQIKDRVSDRGGERVVAELLAERRTRALEGRSNILLFLARCLAFLDLPPGQVRVIARRVFDHVFSADQSQRTTAAVPLGVMLVSCSPCRETVRTELEARVEAMIQTGDPDTVLDALRLGIWANSGSLAEYRLGRRLPHNVTLAAFWNEVVVQQLETHRTSILAAARDDAGFRYAALTHDMLTVEQVLNDSERPMAALFGTNSTGLYDVTWAPYMLGVIGTAIGAYHSIPRAREHCGTLGRFLTDSWPTPPWNLAAVGWNANLLSSSAHAPELAGIQYVGAAIGLLVFAEHIIQGTPDLVMTPDALGPLHALRPYLEQRMGASPKAPLPDLPLPAHIQRTIRDWAHREFDFDIAAKTGKTA